MSALTRADSFVIGQDIVENPKNRTNKKVKAKRKKTKPYKYRREIVYYQALQNMCGGYYKVIITLIINPLTTSIVHYSDH